MTQDVHPIRQGEHERSLNERMAELEYAVSILWDQVWWLSISQEDRDKYAKEGYSDPIKQFYVPLKQVHRRGG